MTLPKWILNFKEPKTEIKLIKGGYYTIGYYQNVVFLFELVCLVLPQ
jgi:hypothetical protein